MQSKKARKVDWPALIKHTKQVTGLNNRQLGELLGLAISGPSGTRPRACNTIGYWVNGRRVPPYYLKLALMWIEEHHSKEN